MNILIVDDSRFLRLANERALTKAGYNVITASDGEEGLQLARERRPDLVILDMMLPKLSGQDVLHALRGDPETAAMPVMVLTSLPQCNEYKLRNEGATSFHQKGLLKLDKDTSLFVQTVDLILSRAAREKTSTVAAR
jgi:two-component system, OmpR family, phosphate regulon response regulator PhoB